MALTKTPVAIVAPATNVAGGSTYGTVDLRSCYGGMLSLKIINGGSAPSTQAVANVLLAHSSGATPATGPAGTDWKTLFSVANGVTAFTVGEWCLPIDPGIAHLEVEFTGNTGADVWVEAYITQLTSLS